MLVFVLWVIRVFGVVKRSLNTLLVKGINMKWFLQFSLIVTLIGPMCFDRIKWGAGETLMFNVELPKSEQERLEADLEAFFRRIECGPLRTLFGGC
jgi:hypothetical protein